MAKTIPAIAQRLSPEPESEPGSEPMAVVFEPRAMSLPNPLMELLDVFTLAVSEKAVKQECWMGAIQLCKVHCGDSDG